MPYPVAHGLLGAAVVAALGEEAPRKRRVLEIAVGAFIAILPDFDYGLNYLVKHPGGGGWHHGFTHSFVFAAAAGLLTAFVMGRRSPRIILTFTLAVASHPLLDYVLTEGRGIALLWPFTDERYRLGTAGSIYHSWRSGEHDEALSGVGDMAASTGSRRAGRLATLLARMAIVSVMEALVFLPLLLGALWWRRKTATRRPEEAAV